MGLANHRKALRAEIAFYAERFREQQVEAMTTALRRYGYEVADVPPVVWAVFATSVSQSARHGAGARNFVGAHRNAGFLRGVAAALEGERGRLRTRRPPDRRLSGYQLRTEQSAPFGP